MRSYVAAISMCIVSFAAHGSEQIQYGWNPGFYYLTVDDPQGDTHPVSDFSPFSGSLSYEYARDSRVYIDAHYIDVSTDPGVNRVGQGVKSYQIGLSQQHRLRFTHFKLWAGYGVAFQQSNFTQRYTVDRDGYAMAHYSDRKGSNLGLLLNLQKQWSYNNNYSLGIAGQYFYALDHGISGTNVSVMLIF